MRLSQNIWSDPNLIQTLKNGGVAVMPTDTIYGIVGLAFKTDAVARIFKIKNRNPNKPCINLIGSLKELEKFSIHLSLEQKKQIESFQEPTSFIIDDFSFRLPAIQELRDMLLQTGPLIAPSANLEGMPPAENILEARKYFGDSVDLYIEGGQITGKASKLIKLHKDGSILILRA